MLALNYATGELVWSFQVVHHDLWDYDVASQPSLIQFHNRPAVAVTTKMGNVFVLDPGAFTPTCSAQHVPSYLSNYDSLKAKGVSVWLKSSWPVTTSRLTISWARA
jgi:glucose dehydrogenase